MMPSRETVMGALFTHLQQLAGINSFSRRMTLPPNVPVNLQPCLMQWEQPETERAITNLPARRLLEAWIVIVFTNQDTTVAGASIINPILDALEGLLGVDDFGRNTCSLGGLVHYARIEGSILKETGDTDPSGLGGAVVPIKIMLP
jgi:hypothetical protein